MPDLIVSLETTRKWLWVAAVAGLAAYCWQFWPVGPGVKLYLEGARCLLDGLPLQQCDKTFTYPPFFALTMMPFLALPAMLVNAIWYVITVGAVAGCFMVSVALARRLIPGDWQDRDIAWLYCLGIALSLKFLFAALSNQSYDAVVVLSVLFGLLWLLDKRPAWAGVAFGLATALKATPLLFLPYLIFTRRFAAAATMTAAIIVLSLLPDLLFAQPAPAGWFAHLRAWIAAVAEPALVDRSAGVPHVFWYGGNGNNFSLRGIVGFFWWDGDPSFRPTLYSLYAGYIVVVVAIVMRSYRRDWAIVTDGALLLLSMLMLSPMSSESHVVALIPTIAVIAAVWVKDGERMRRIAGFFLIVIFVTTNLTSHDLVGRAVTTWAHHYRIMTLGMLSLLIFFAIYADRRVRREAASHTQPVAAGEIAAKPGTG